MIAQIFHKYFIPWAQLDDFSLGFHGLMVAPLPKCDIIFDILSLPTKSLSVLSLSLSLMQVVSNAFVLIVDDIWLQPQAIQQMQRDRP